MTIYWFLFGFAALMALGFSVAPRPARLGATQSLALVVFALFYTAIATARFEIGGDWGNYIEIYGEMVSLRFTEAVQSGDPLFSVMMWLSAQLGWGVYMPNGVCAGLMVWGAVRLAQRTREPWLALVIAVPYLLIVVGMGYVRQAGAIGLIMMAMAGLGRQNRVLTIVQLGAAAGLHSSAGVVFPLFALAVARRNMALAGLMGLAAAAFVGLMLQRLAVLETNYIEESYDSDGATVRVLMNVVPSIYLLARWRRFEALGMERRLWLVVAVANLVALAALYLSPSSTAVDRIALYFAPVQLIAFGNALWLSGLGQRSAYLVRILALVIAGFVQVVWLLLATNAQFWVPYRSVLELL